MIGGRFQQFLDRDELSETRLYSPLALSVHNEMEARLSIGFSAKGYTVSLLERSLSLVDEPPTCGSG